MSAFETTPRARLTDQKRAAVFLAGNGCCYLCSRRIWPGEKWQVEHKTALLNGGSDDFANMAPVCNWCHPAKTRQDHAVGRKARHVATKHVIHSDQRVRTSQAMPGTKASGLRKKFNGEVERR
jgi:hypothetical protein